jgi:hypothetical protein
LAIQFEVSAVIQDSEGGGAHSFITLPSCVIGTGGPFDWEENTPWTVGSNASVVITAQGESGFGLGNWSFDGFTGSFEAANLFASSGEFTVEAGSDGTIETPVTWTGDLYLYSDVAAATPLFEIQMEGVGTATITGLESDGLFYVGTGTADVTGEGQVIYEAPSVPEPSTFTLLFLGIASILAMRFRRTTATQS